jgi:hypothetical protein
MNRRQQPAPPRPPQQQQRQPQPQPQAKPIQSTQYNPNSANRQLPTQVTIPQAISILVARINQLEDKCAVKVHTGGDAIDTSVMVDMTARIVSLELDLLNAKNHIMQLQSFTLDKVQVQTI